MKNIHLLLPVLFAFAVMVPSLAAESPNERDYKQLRANRDKAAAAALEPINRRYKEELDKLFKKATQAAELDLARDIQGELQVAGGAAAAKSAGGSPAGTTAPNAPADKTDLRKLIENSEWSVWEGLKEEGEATGRTIFQRGGKMSGSGQQSRLKYYALAAPDILKLYQRDPKTNPKEEYYLVRVDMSGKTATKDASLSTLGGSIFLKYDGPAKAAK